MNETSSVVDLRGRHLLTLADYSLTPDVAIVDPQFVMSMPKGLTADTGIDCLTHALEAVVSSYASPYTDSNAMQAVNECNPQHHVSDCAQQK